MAKSNPFSRDFDFYTVQSLESFIGSASKQEMSALRAEYTRLRDIAQKRVKRLGQSEFKESAAYKSHVVKITDNKGKVIKEYPGFRKLSDMDPRDLAKAMSELSKFVHASTSTVTGQKEARSKTQEKFREDYKLELNNDNFFPFLKVLNELRRQKRVYDSERVLEAVNSILSKGWDVDELLKLDNFYKLIEHSESIKDIPIKAGTNMNDYINSMGW